MKQLFPATELRLLGLSYSRDRLPRCGDPPEGIERRFRGVSAGSGRAGSPSGTPGNPSGPPHHCVCRGPPAARLKDPPRRASPARAARQLPPQVQAFSAGTRGPARTPRAPAPPRLYAPACAPPLPLSPCLPLFSLSLPPVVAAAARAAGLERG